MTPETSTPSALHPMPRRIIKNTLFSTAGNWFLLLINFLIIPYIIRRLGVDLYGGAWIVGAMVISLISFLDFGITSSCTKYIAEYSATHQYDQINNTISTGIVFYLVFGGALTMLVLICGHQLLALIGVPSHLLAEAFFVLAIALSIMLLTNAMAPITATIAAMQRFDVTNIIVVVTSSLNFAVTIFVLQNGWGARGLIMGNLVVQLISLSWMLYWAKKLLPQISPRPSKVQWKVFQQLSRFGGNLQLSRISQIIVFQGDKIVALRFFGTSAAAFYEVAVKVSSLARTLPLVLASALLPAASAIDAEKDEQKVLLLFERGTKYLIIVGALILGFVFSESHLIVATWMGRSLGQEGIDTASNLIKILVTGYFLNIATGVASSIAAGIGKTYIERRLGTIFIVMSPALLFTLFKALGFYGIPLATTISLSLGTAYYMKSFCSAIGAKESRYWSLFLRPFSGIAIALAVMKLFQWLMFHSESLSRFEGVLSLGILFSIFFCFYVGVLWVTKAFDQYDMLVIKALVGKLPFQRTSAG